MGCLAMGSWLPAHVQRRKHGTQTTAERGRLSSSTAGGPAAAVAPSAKATHVQGLSENRVGYFGLFAGAGFGGDLGSRGYLQRETRICRSSLGTLSTTLLGIRKNVMCTLTAAEERGSGSLELPQPILQPKK